MQFDKDAVYIDIGRVNYTKKENLDLPKVDDNSHDESSSSEEEEIDLDAPAGLLKSLQDVKDGVDQKMKYSSLRLFKGSKAVKSGDDEEESGYSMNKNQKRRPVDEAFELANSFRRRFDEEDVENENSGSESESSDDDSSESERDDDDDDDDIDSAHDNDSSSSDWDDEDEGEEGEYSKDGSGSGRDDEEMAEEKQTWKTNIAKQAAMNYRRRERSVTNLQQLVYGTSEANSNLVSDEEKNDRGKDGSDDEEDSDEEFFTLRNKSKQSSITADSSKGDTGQSVMNDIQLGEIDSSRKMPIGASGVSFDVEAWLEEGDNCLIESIRDKFVTGNWDNGEEKGVGAEEFDDFEDLEAGAKYGPNGEVIEDSDEDEATAGMTDSQLREFNAKKKAAQKSGFDDDYDESKKGNVGKPGDEQAENEYVEALKRDKEARLKRNEAEFGGDGESSRLRFEGFRQGIYCRVRIDGIPAEFIQSFDPTMPLVIGGLTPQETERGLVRCRFKKHRWHKKILKCNDPLVFSIGWRRFQSIPVFSTEDQNGRYRYLKYTPEHMHCQATFYGPQAPPNTGVSAAFPSLTVTDPFKNKLIILLLLPLSPFLDFSHPTTYWKYSRLSNLCDRCGP